MNDDDDKVEQLHAELTAAIRAFRDHARSGILTQWGGQPAGRPDEPVDMDWMSRYSELYWARKQAEAAVLDHMTTSGRMIGPAPLTNTMHRSLEAIAGDDEEADG